MNIKKILILTLKGSKRKHQENLRKHRKDLNANTESF